MSYRPMLASLVVAFWVLPASARADSNCPGANPFDSAPDDVEINACLSGGGVVTLEGHAPGGGGAFYWIQHPLTISVSGTTLTSGTPGQRAYLMATNDLYGPLLQTAAGVNGYELSELVFAGGVYGRTHLNDCQGYRDFGSNLVLTGDGFVVRNIDTAGAMCGTSLGVDGSNFEITGVSSYENGIPEDEPHSAPEPWSDGITLGRCDNGYVHDNWLADNTDVEIVIGGGTNCRVQNNTIQQHYKHAFAGIHVTKFEGGGSHSGSVFSGNVIDSYQNRLAFGIIVGPHPWNERLDVTDSGSAFSNQLTGSVVNLAVDGIFAGSVNANSMSGAQGTYGFHCDLAANYTADHYGSASIQQSPSPVLRNYDFGTCTR